MKVGQCHLISGLIGVVYGLSAALQVFKRPLHTLHTSICPPLLILSDLKTFLVC